MQAPISSALYIAMVEIQWDVSCVPVGRVNYVVFIVSHRGIDMRLLNNRSSRAHQAALRDQVVAPVTAQAAHRQPHHVHDRLGTQVVMGLAEDCSIHYLGGVRVAQERLAVLHPKGGVWVQEEHVVRECQTSPRTIRILSLGAGTTQTSCK